MSRPCTRTIGGRADLLRILGEAPEGALEKAAGLLGYAAAAPPGAKHEISKAAVGPASEPVATSQSYSEETLKTLAQVPFWRLTERQPTSLLSYDDDRASGRSAWVGLAKREPPRRPLCPWPSLLPRLRNALAEPSPTHALDVAKLVRLMSRGEPLTALPRKTRRRWPQRLQIVEDFATRLTPIWRDQKQVSVDMARLLPNAGMDITRLQDGLASGTVFGAVPDRLQSEASSGVPVLVMGDLGVLGASPAASLDLWMTFAQERKAEGRRCIALTPAPLSAYPEPVRKLWSLVPWEEKPQRAIAEPGRANQADRLLGLLSHHMKIPPGLLRDVRRLYPEMSAVTEIQAWRSPHLVSPHPIAATLSNAAKEQLRGHFRAEPLERKQQIYRLIRKWCGGDYDSVYFEAVLSLGALAADVVGPADTAAAVECIRDMAGIVDCASAPVRLRGVGKPQVERYFREMRGRIGDAPKEITAASESFDRLSAAVAPGKSDDAYPTGFDPAVLGPLGPQRKLTLRQRGGQLVAMPARQAGLFESWPADDAEGSLLTDIITARDDLAVWENPFWKTGAPPNWTSDYGIDEFGPWVEFTITDADGAMIRQRMQWIGPGRFRMGSPDDEPGRYDNEGPRHEVRISEGFWLFDTPVTQALWEAVMGANPSRFVDPKRPVELVSWDDAADFLAKINARVPGLELVLPTEAQWEYACRAGTETATYAGPMKILGDNNAPILDGIAWYGGNSGVGFELENGYDSLNWPKKQYDHSRAGTHPVAQKQPNGWGLYDMLGNVWEWCADDRRNYGSDAASDPVGSLDSAQRALRGGSWFYYARIVRAASRYAFDRDYRHDCIGFRCARVRAEPAETGPSRAERQPAPARPGGAKLLSSAAGLGKPSIALPKRRGFVVRSDCETLTFETVTRPDWANAMGRDRYGLWVEFSLGAATQRMRWIAPGRFRMGSPYNEEGRFDDESPQHDVTLTKGYWLADTPVTQALWREVMGDNPSQFTDPIRPVERVSWDGAMQFLERINQMISALDLALPTEAQWEYACRAGTDMQTYAGDGESALNMIAWYGGNSGQQTQPIKQKRCNDWGLYDMLGNVWEWCADDLRSYGSDAASDPVGSLDSAQRALRGGSWYDDARNVRAARRYAYDRDYRYDDLGFRCARVRP